jgi:hypothetical protein
MTQVSENIEKKREYMRAYLKAYRSRPEYIEKNRAYMREYMKKYALNNKEKIKEISARCYQKNKEKILEKNRAYRQKKAIECTLGVAGQISRQKRAIE